MRIDPTERLASRERKILDLLDKWPWKIGGTLIGGYAIAAYGTPRYSKDADIVISAALKSSLKTFLLEQGFKLERSDHPNPQDFEGEVTRYRNEEATVDLFVGYVRDRKTQVDISEHWISKNTKRIHLRTLTGTTTVPVNVARPTALWALKLQSGRDQDILDLFAIADVPIEAGEIISLFGSFNSKTLREGLLLTLERAQSVKLFQDAMARLQIKRTDESRKRWNLFCERVSDIVEKSV